jgi:hypothetical protein
MATHTGQPAGGVAESYAHTERRVFAIFMIVGPLILPCFDDHPSRARYPDHRRGGVLRRRARPHDPADLHRRRAGEQRSHDPDGHRLHDPRHRGGRGRHRTAPRGHPPLLAWVVDADRHRRHHELHGVPAAADRLRPLRLRQRRDRRGAATPDTGRDGPAGGVSVMRPRRWTSAQANRSRWSTEC